jgi:recombination protein RecA
MAANSRSTVERAGDREKSLEAALIQIERQFGKGSIMRLGEETRVPVEVIPTGSIALDVALGLGGLPRGRIVEIYGPESSGKTTVALHAVANAQKMGGIAAFIDTEHALDPDYANKLGVDTDALLVSQPDTGEQALEIADMLIRSGALDVIVIDSVAALVPKAEIEGEMGDSHVGLQARLMSQALRKITGALNQAKTTAIFTNQLREKVGVMFGSPETTSGGKALKFYASVRLDVRRIETLKDGTDAVGNRTRVKVVKNKMSPPFKVAEFDILYGVGISREGSLIDLGVEQGIVRKSGAWYTYEGDQLGQGKENARNFLRENPDVANEIEKRIKEKLGVGARLDADAQADAVKGNGSAPASASGASAPGASAPGASAPGASAPGASAPGASAPGASAPGASAPGASAPGAGAPGASASGGSAAGGARPNGSAANGAPARAAATVPGATV